jgi:hypothetical protein
VEVNIVQEVAGLERLSVGQLRQRFAELFGEATLASNRIWLIKRIAWRMQALAEGDLSERARRRAAELARDADLRLNPPRSASIPPPPQPIPHRWRSKAAAAPAGRELEGPVCSFRSRGTRCELTAIPQGWRGAWVQRRFSRADAPAGKRTDE